MEASTFHFSPEMSASLPVRHSFFDIGNQSVVMSFCVLDLPTPNLREGGHPQAIFPPP